MMSYDQLFYDKFDKSHQMIFTFYIPMSENERNITFQNSSHYYFLVNQSKYHMVCSILE